jgi:hypothetical protein
MEENFGEGPAKMGLKRCCGPLKPFAAILNEFRQRYAFRGNFRNPNIGVFNRICPKYMMLQDARTSEMRLRAVSGFLKHFQHLFPPPAFENHWHPLGSRQK